MNLGSIRFRISLLYSFILGIILIAYSSILYLSFSYVVYRDIDMRLKEKVQEIQNTITAYSEVLVSEEAVVSMAINRTLHLEEAEKKEFFQWPSIVKLDRSWKYKSHSLGLKYDNIIFFSPDGTALDQSYNIDEATMQVLRQNFLGSERDKQNIKNIITQDLHLRVITWPYYSGGKTDYVMQLATSLNPIIFVLDSRLKLILFTIPVILLLTSFLGGFFANKILKPIKNIAETAQGRTHKDMSKRVEQRLADDEIRSLVDAFNDMISRLEKSFSYIEEFSSQVAHELKTPLAVIRGEAEIALKRERDAEEYKRIIKVCLEEAERMHLITNDLLLLTKLDYQPEVFEFEKFDFNQFIKKIHSQSKVLASEKKIKIQLELPEGETQINANKLHLRRLFFNLIDNAIKFTHSSGKISIKVSSEKGEIKTFISDTGIGIPEEDVKKIFNRFFRIDSLSQSEEHGNGLGLSIVQAIASIHQGKVQVQSSLGKGTTFTVILPQA